MLTIRVFGEVLREMLSGLREAILISMRVCGFITVVEIMIINALLGGWAMATTVTSCRSQIEYLNEITPRVMKQIEEAGARAR